jgi:hypothetical protein
MKRWPDLTAIKTQKLSMLRTKFASKEKLSNYYKELGTLKKTMDYMTNRRANNLCPTAEVYDCSAVVKQIK